MSLDDFLPSPAQEARALTQLRGEPGDPSCTECKGGGVSDVANDGVTYCVCSKCIECGQTTFEDPPVVLGPADARGRRVCEECARETVARYLGGAMTLSAALAELGFGHRANDRTTATSKREILRAGRVVFVGTCVEVNAWLARGADWAAS